MKQFVGNKLGRGVFLCAAMALASAASASAQLFYAADTNGNIDLITSGGASIFTTSLAGDNLGGMIFDGSGNLFVADSTAGAVYEFNSAGTRTTFATGLMSPGDVAIDSAGNVYVANSAAGTILKYAPGGGTPTTYATGLNMPEAITFDPANVMYVAEQGANQVSKVPAGGGAATVFASGITAPVTLTLDSTAANIYVGVQGGSTVSGFSIATGAAVNTYAGSTLDETSDINIDSAGNLYAAQYSDTIVEVAAGQSAVTTFSTGTSTSLLGFVEVVPEPAPAWYVLLGTAGLLAARWLRRRRAA